MRPAATPEARANNRLVNRDTPVAEFRLGSADNFYVQRFDDRDQWNNVFGEAGNDDIRLYQGTAVGGPGNDRFERLPVADQPWRNMDVAYWDSPAGVRVDLALGTAQDGYGGVDTLIGIRNVHASGYNDWFNGNAENNFFWGNGGNDTMLGGAGDDGAGLNHFTPSVGPGRNAKLADVSIVVSPDGRNAVIKPLAGTGFLYTLTDIEYIQTEETPNNWLQTRLSDFITQQSIAEQAIAAGPTLRWNAAQALGTATSVSYSFVTSAPASGVGAAGFRAFTPAEQQAVRDILAQAAAVAGISFNEVAEAGATVGQLRFGVSQQATSKGVSWLPGQAGAGDQSGDVWMDVESMLNLAPGSEGYQALLHEIGHALGLRHGRNTDAGDSWAVQMRSQDDRSALTVMSGEASADGLFRANWGPLDVLALRYLYGARNVNTGDTRYALGSAQANAQTSITDDGGRDTLDASAYAVGVSLNLKAGGLSSVGLSSTGFTGVDNLALVATSLIENAVGTAYDDVLLGNELDNTLTGGLGNDAIDGGKGVDTAVFAGARQAYEISNAFGITYVRARDGSSGYDNLVNIESLAFADQTLALGASPLSEDIKRSVDEDSSLGAALPDPSDVARSAVSYSLLGAAAHGTSSITANGNFTYTPASNYWGADAFSYQISGAGGANRYTVFLNVLPINDGPPLAAPATYIVPVASLFNGQLPVASDVDGDTIVYALGTEPTKGTATVSAHGAFTYQPNGAAYADDSFGYSVSDGQGGSNSYTITVRAGLVTQEDTVLSQLLPDPPTGLRSAASYALGTPAGHGVVSINAAGQLSYTPATNYFGSDSFAYDLTAVGSTTRITVPIRINSVSDGPPVAASAARSTDEDTPLSGALPTATDPDNGAIVYSLSTPAAHGTANVSASGQFSYTPAANYFGADSFAFTVTDVDGERNSYSLSLSVASVNDVPQATPGSASVNEDAVLSASLPAGSDADGDALSYLLLSAAAQGSVVVNANGSYVYTPAANYAGLDSFSFSVSDGRGGQATASLSLTVINVVDTITGTAGNDQLAGHAGGDRYNGLAGNDSISPGAGDDTVDGGEGIDRVSYVGRLAAIVADLAAARVLIGAETDALQNIEALWGGSGADRLSGNAGANQFFGGPGNDTLDGAGGFDVVSYAGAVAVSLNLAGGSAAQGLAIDSLANIEAVLGSATADSLTGLDGAATHLGEVFRPVGGNDTVAGGAGVDTVEFTGPRANYSINRPSLASDALSVTQTAGALVNDGTDALSGIERLLFTDRLLAFGSRAEEVAKVAFVLWSPAVATNADLFGIGIGFYDTGLAYAALIDAALSYWTLSDSALALQLLANVPGTAQTATSLATAMAGKGGGRAGQLEAIRVMAEDPANLANISAAGLRANGIEASLVVNGVPRFAAQLAVLNLAPSVAGGNASVNEDGALAGRLPSASDADGDTLSYSRASNALHGSVSVSADGSYSYTPAANYHGPDSFTFTVADGQGGTTTATQTLSVIAINDLPVASTGSATLSEDTVFNGTLPLASDVDGDALSYSRLSGPAHGSVTVSVNGGYGFTPEANYSGSDSFSYQVSDGKGGTATASVSLLINSVVDVFSGSASADQLGAYPGADRYLGLGGNDSITPGLGDDTIDGGDGLDRVSYTERSAALSAHLATGRVTLGSETDSVQNIEAIWAGAGNDSLTGDAANNAFWGGPGNDSMDGGGGIDLASYEGGAAVIANLLTGLATQGGDSDQLTSIEVLIGSAFADTFTGLNGPDIGLGESFRPGAGNDNINGGSGVDRVEFSGPRSAYVISRPSLASDALSVSHLVGGGDGSDALVGVERLLFSDRLLAFGSRADELAKVVFALWSSTVANDKDLFAIGVHYYDSGVSYDTLIGAALGYWAHRSNDALAQQLINDVPGTGRTKTELLALMGGFIDPQLGRAAATKLMADDPANLINIDLAGLRSSGIEAGLTIDGAVVFGPWPGG